MSLFSLNCAEPQTTAAAADPTKRWVAPEYRITETTESANVRVLLPGVAKADLSITAEAEAVWVEARRREETAGKGKVLHRESRAAHFRLKLDVSSAYDVPRIQAELADGVLRLTIPKSEAAKPRQIAVG